MTTRVDMIIETLKANPDQFFTAKDLAKLFIQRYPKEIADKQKNYESEEKLISQLTAEIGGKRTERVKQKCHNIITRDKPRPRLYCWQSKPTQLISQMTTSPQNLKEDQELVSETLSEQDLYPLLMEFLKEEFKLFCRRIDEKTSKNSHGSGGNHWLHPDVVALEALDKEWQEEVSDCVRNSGSSTVRLWSFEVKKQLTRANVRSYFFQTVSNSSWANLGYLVITGLDNNVESELQMLCGLHGIGVLLLNTESLFDSQILIPAKLRSEIDWLSVNRIVEENNDFKKYIEQVGIYLQTRKLTTDVWNK
ncbi:hypothetical protein EV697_1029 [Bisgaardia hudsonensis]|uniref:HrgA protein n=1 Tax=Bisgaardia hudsonensis TaxID=109472 RepID=A0A4R2N0U7_9PAST|nr:HrgA protein [Bisgaardia hudsonensis]QLB13279.1 HrgA protein [Bisgaardia hudsonensis]TCP13140.1 hypothetical protein EV697_1029 [Bisgaardia hudsonensis]